mgnify:FL=1
MNNIIHAIEALAIIFTLASPYIVYQLWTTTSSVLFVLFICLFTGVTAFVSFMAVYAWATYL